jgi:hypothetical protein
MQGAEEISLQHHILDQTRSDQNPRIGQSKASAILLAQSQMSHRLTQMHANLIRVYPRKSVANFTSSLRAVGGWGDGDEVFREAATVVVQ